MHICHLMTQTIWSTLTTWVHFLLAFISLCLTTRNSTVLLKHVRYVPQHRVFAQLTSLIKQRHHPQLSLEELSFTNSFQCVTVLSKPYHQAFALNFHEFYHNNPIRWQDSKWIWKMEWIKLTTVQNFLKSTHWLS